MLSRNLADVTLTGEVLGTWEKKTGYEGGYAYEDHTISGQETAGRIVVVQLVGERKQQLEMEDVTVICQGMLLSQTEIVIVRIGDIYLGT